MSAPAELEKAEPTKRFTNRVAEYVRFRPDYPDELLDQLEATSGVDLDGARIADLGSGTGIMTEQLMARGAQVWAVEPNDAMRAAAEAQLGAHASFHSVNAPAEATTLPDDSVDLVTAAQAFHWFDPHKTRAECRRILARDDGKVALMWNRRSKDATSFLIAYENFLDQWAEDYSEVDHTRDVVEDRLRTFYGGAFHEFTYRNEQRVDLQGLTGRLLSSSYVPRPDSTEHPMYGAIRVLFDAFAEDDGRVSILYDTKLYIGFFNQGAGMGLR